MESCPKLNQAFKTVVYIFCLEPEVILADICTSVMYFVFLHTQGKKETLVAGPPLPELVALTFHVT